MSRPYQTFAAIEYAFVIALLASLGVVGAGGLAFGFQVSQWDEWQGILTGVVATVAGIGGAASGVRLARGKRSVGNPS
jgi:hypothetical protein